MLGANGSVISALTDPTKQAEVYSYLQSLKNDESGWKKSVTSIVSSQTTSAEEHFLLLQVVEEYLQKRYVDAAPSDCQIVRDFLTHYITIVHNSKDIPVFLVNKMAHIFALAFSVDFPIKWSSYFDDLFFTRNLTERGMALFYLKVLLDIDAEVVDRDIQRSQEQSDRNGKIKDAMREICINQIAESWHTISSALPDDDVIQCLILDTIASYVDWIELDLVANDVIMLQIISRFQKPSTSESATHAVCSLLQKGMPPEKKVRLSLTIMEVLRANGLLSIAQESTEEDVSRVGSIVNTLGLVLLEVHNKLCASSILEKEQESCLVELSGLAVPALAILNNEDPDLSELCIDFIRAYSSFLIRFTKNCDFIEKVIQTTLVRYVMSDDLNVDGDGEEVTEFHEYRKELRSMLNVIGIKQPHLIVHAIEPWVIDVTRRSSELHVNRVEALLSFIYHLHEVIPSNMLQTVREGVSERAASLPIAILEGLVLDGRSATINVMFFELACRYERLLSLHSQSEVIPQIAEAFLDQRGIANPVSNVRTRIVYLFCRFVKSHKTVLSGLVSEVITRLAPLLAVSPQTGANQMLSSDDQAYIFEATATLIVFGNLSTELKVRYFEELSSSLASKFENGLAELALARSRNADEETKRMLINFNSNIVIYCCRMSKAFNNVQSMKTCGCVDIFLGLVQLFINALTVENCFLLEAVRQFAHRLVVSMEEELMPYMNKIFEKLALVSTDLDSMQHLLIFCHQAVAKFKKSILSSGINLANVFAIAARTSRQSQNSFSTSKDDSNRSLIYVQRAFLQLLHTVIVSDCATILTSTPGLLDHVLETVEGLALSTDQTAQKVALACLSKVSHFAPAWSIRTLRVALQVPSLSHITPSDAGSTIVIHEVCATLLNLSQSDPDGFSSALRDLLPDGFSDRLLNALASLRGKQLDKEVMLLYATLRVQSK